MSIENLFIAEPKPGSDQWTVGWTASGATERATFNNEESAREFYERLKAK